MFKNNLKVALLCLGLAISAPSFAEESQHSAPGHQGMNHEKRSEMRAEKFEEKKAEVLQNMQARQQCVQASINPGDLKKCHTIHRHDGEMKEKAMERHEKRQERRDDRRAQSSQSEARKATM